MTGAANGAGTENIGRAGIGGTSGRAVTGLSYQTAMSKTHRGMYCVQSPRRLSSHWLGRPGALARLPTCNEFHSMQVGIRTVRIGIVDVEATRGGRQAGG